MENLTPNPPDFEQTSSASLSKAETETQKKATSLVNLLQVDHTKSARSQNQIAPQIHQEAFKTVVIHTGRVTGLSRSMKVALVIASTLNKTLHRDIPTQKLKLSLAFDAFIQGMLDSIDPSSSLPERRQFIEHWEGVNTTTNLFLDSLSPEGLQALYDQFGNAPLVSGRFKEEVEQFLGDLGISSALEAARLFSDYADFNILLENKSAVTELGKNNFIRLLTIYHHSTCINDTLFRELIDQDDPNAVRTFLNALCDKKFLDVLDAEIVHFLQKDETGHTALIHAVDSESREMFPLLLHAYIQHVDAHLNETAVTEVFFDTCAYILDKKLDNILKEDAALFMLQSLIQTHPKVVHFVKEMNGKETTLLTLAALHGNIPSVKMVAEGALSHVKASALQRYNQAVSKHGENENTPIIRALLGSDQSK